MSGIAVRVGANTSEFNKSMAQMKRDLKETQSALSVTATQAKLFGNATDQLKIKQTELSSKLKIQNSMLSKQGEFNTKLKNNLAELNTENGKLKTKIEETNKAYKKSADLTGEDSKASLALKKELDGLKQEYNKNGNAIESTDKKIQNNIIIMNNSEKAILETKKALEQTNKELKNSNWDTFNKKMDGTRGKADKVVSAMKPVAMATVAIGTAGAVASLTFEESIAKVSTIMDTTSMSIGDMKKKIMELSNETGISSNEIADNVYEAISSGADTSEAIDMVAQSAKLARAGFTDSASSLDVLTTIMNAYGESAGNANHISDVLMNTQNLGKVTVGELASQIGTVIPTANMYSVSLEQLSAGYSVLTSNGIKAEQSTTTLNAMFGELGKSGTKSSDILKEKTGKSFKELMDSGMSLTDVLSVVKAGADESGLSIADMFGSTEASKAAQTLLANTDKFTNDLGVMQNSVGVTDEAFKKMDTTGHGFKESLNKIGNAAIKLGDVLAPVINFVAGFFSGLADILSNMGTIPMVALILNGGLVLVIVGIAMAIIKVIDTIRMIKEAFEILKTVGLAVKAFALANPIGLVIIAIVAVVAILVTLYNKCEWFRNGVNGIITGVIGFFKNFSGFMTNVFTTDWTQSFGVFGNVMNGFFATASDIWESIKRVFSGVVDFVTGVFTGDWSKAWSGIVNIFGGIMDGLGAVMKAPLNFVIALINMAIDGLNQISFTAPDWVPGVGGKHFGVNLPKIRYLYNGGIISRPTMISSNVMAGDQFQGSGIQTEVVAPLDPFYKNIKNIVKAESGQQPVYVVVNVDNNMDGDAITKTLTTKVKKEITREVNNYKKSKGGFSLA